MVFYFFAWKFMVKRNEIFWYNYSTLLIRLVSVTKKLEIVKQRIGMSSPSVKIASYNKSFKFFFCYCELYTFVICFISTNYIIITNWE